MISVDGLTVEFGGSALFSDVSFVSTWNHNQTDNTEMTGTGIANNKYLWEGLEKAAVQKNSSSYTMSKGCLLYTSRCV